MEENNTDTNLPQPNMTVRWTNRRRMAWTALVSMILVTILILFTDLVPDTRLKILSEVITWFYFCSVSVVGAYMGLTTYASVKGLREEKYRA